MIRVTVSVRFIYIIHHWLVCRSAVHTGNTYAMNLPASCITKLITGSIAHSASRQHLICSQADFEVFHPTGATRCTDGVKFNKGAGPQKLKFLHRFDQNVEYKCPAGAYLLRDFHKTCRVCTPFQGA